MDLLAVGAGLRAGAAAMRQTADGLEAAAKQVDSYAGDAGDAAGHPHVRDGLADFADFHRGVLHLLALAVEAIAQDTDGFDAAMGRADDALSARNH